jgi:hypothetical protein
MAPGASAAEASQASQTDWASTGVSNAPASFAAFNYTSPYGFQYTEAEFNRQLAARETSTPKALFPRPLGVALDDWNKAANASHSEFYHFFGGDKDIAANITKYAHKVRERAEEKLYKKTLQNQPPRPIQQYLPLTEPTSRDPGLSVGRIAAPGARGAGVGGGARQQILPAVIHPNRNPKVSASQPSFSSTPSNNTMAPNVDNNKDAAASSSGHTMQPPKSKGKGPTQSRKYCVCQSNDDGRKMIGCDGGCGDWFHSDCISISAEEQHLIDKFICHNCTQPGKVTTYKRICRLATCNKPYLINPTTGKASKYCSVAHRNLFMKRIVEKMPKVKTPGGALTAAEARAILRQTERGQFRTLGLQPTLPLASVSSSNGQSSNSSASAPSGSNSSIPAPAKPASGVPNAKGSTATMGSDQKQVAQNAAAPKNANTKSKGSGSGQDASASKVGDNANTTEDVNNDNQGLGLIDAAAAVDNPDAAELNRQEVSATFKETEWYNKAERTRRREGKAKIADAEAQLLLQEDRWKLLSMVKKRSDKIVEEYSKENNIAQTAPKQTKSGKKPVNVVCGYDPRLQCDDQWLEAFKNSPEGVKAFETGIIEEDVTGSVEMEKTDHKGICTKVKCINHGGWYDLHVDEVTLKKKIAKETISKTKLNLDRMRNRAEVRQAVVLHRKNYAKWRLEQMPAEEAKIFENAIQSKNGDPEVILRKMFSELSQRG